MVYNAKIKTLLLALAATVPILMSSPGVAQLCGPVQRYASVRSDEVNVRTGPHTKHPIEWVFLLKNMPVAVIAEYEHWRRICDWEGVTGWVHRAMLSPKRTLIVSSDENIRHSYGTKAPKYRCDQPVERGAEKPEPLVPDPRETAGKGLGSDTDRLIRVRPRAKGVHDHKGFAKSAATHKVVARIFDSARNPYPGNHNAQEIKRECCKI